jgi:hypothetical protein
MVGASQWCLKQDSEARHRLGFRLRAGTFACWGGVRIDDADDAPVREPRGSL